MSEELNKDLSITEIDEGKNSLPKEPERKLSRREALLGALFGAGLAVAKSASAADACSCLAPPDCSKVCTNGGTPKGDGTQACDCNPTGYAQVAYTGKYSDLSGTPTIPTLATVAYTGSYNDLSDKPSSNLTNIVSAGSAGPTGNSTFASVSYSKNDYRASATTGSINVPYFRVNSQGRVTSYGTKTVTFGFTTYAAYSDYTAYYDTNCNDAE